VPYSVIRDKVERSRTTSTLNGVRKLNDTKRPITMALKIMV